MFPCEYKTMFLEDHEEEKNQPCPPELSQTKILTVRGHECKVYYNYVAPYTYGATPINCWWGILINNEEYNWRYPLSEGVRTFEEACEIILPAFTKFVDKYEKIMAR